MMLLSQPRERDITFATPGDADPFALTLRESTPIGTMIGFGTDTAQETEAQGDFERVRRVANAASRAQQVVDNTYAREAAIEEAIEKRIAAVRDATGVQLQNYALAPDEATMDGFLPPDAQEAPLSGRDQFHERLAQLAEQFPDAMAAIRAGETIEDDARAIAREAQGALERETGEGGAGAAIGGLLGSLAGSLRDPLQVTTLFAGGGAGTAASVAGRIAQVAAREALINAGAVALTQPQAQAWREEAGLRSGIVPALENVGMAALFGGILGGGIAGGREILRAVRPADQAAVERTLAGTATPQEAERALKVLGVPEDERAAVRAATEADAADRAALPDMPAGANPDAHADATSEALMRAERGDVLMQEPVFPVREGITDDAALDVLERGDMDALDALERLRADPELIESALASRSPAVREAGHVAMLGDEAFALVADGSVEPRMAALALRAAVEPERQAALLRDLAQARPASLAEARTVIGDSLAAETAQTSAARIGGVEPWSPSMQEAPARAAEAQAPVSAPTPAGMASDGIPAPAQAVRAVDAKRGTDVLALTPGMDGDGRSGYVPRGAYELAGARDRFLGDVVAACKT